MIHVTLSEAPKAPYLISKTIVDVQLQVSYDPIWEMNTIHDADVTKRLRCRSDVQYLMYSMILRLMRNGHGGELFKITDADDKILMNGILTWEHLPEWFLDASERASASAGEPS
jgi:hypothetical protein